MYKYFDRDKNYILRQVQQQREEPLLSFMVEYTLQFYLKYHNPLGLEDETIRQIKRANFEEYSVFHKFYNRLSGIYRFLHGNDQLEILFDGRSHYEKYTDEWEATFRSWIKKFVLHRFFLMAILEICVFQRGNRFSMAPKRLISFLHDFFEVRYYKRKGLTPWKPKRKVI